MSFYKINSKYKIIFRNRSNIWGRIGLRYKLKKKKWKGLFLYSNFYKKFRMHNKNYVIRHPPLKYAYKTKLQDQQKLKYLYGKVLDRQFKSLVSKVKSSKASIHKSYRFMRLLEKRLDVVLYRSCFFRDIFQIRQFIKRSLIKVNNKVITNFNHFLGLNDVVCLNSFFFKRWVHYLFKDKRKMFRTIRFNVDIFKHSYFTEHLEINYKNLSIMLFKDPDIDNLFYPTRINFLNVWRFYNL